MDDMFGGEQFWQDGPDDGDAEVDALWNGQLSMDRVLQTLQEEIEAKKAAIARAEAAEKRVAELEAELKTEREKPRIDWSPHVADTE